MDSYGLNPTGRFYIEKVQTREQWSSLSIGRLILDLESGNAYIGALDGIYGDKGWIPVGLSNRMIKNYNVDWNYDMISNSDKISSIDIPCYYNSIITDIQSALTDIECNINNIIYNPISIIPPGTINILSLDTTSILGITAKKIPIEDCYDRFISTNIEDALLERLTSAEFIIFPPDTEFGNLLKFDVNNVENALVNLEQYLYTIDGKNIDIDYESTTITIQNAFDNIIDYYLPCFTLTKTSCCDDGQILVSNNNKFECGNIESSLKLISYSGDKFDLQTAYNELCIELNSLKTSNNELNRILDVILSEVGTIYCILEKCVDCDIRNIDCS